MARLSDTIYDDVLTYLDITWQPTEAEQKKIKSMIDRGAAVIKGLIGYSDFVGETPEKALLLAYIMYDRAGAAADWQDHYRKQLTSLRLRHSVEREEARRNAHPETP